MSLNLPPGLSLSSRDDASPTDWGDESVILEGWFTGKVISRDAYAGVSRKEFKVARDEGWYDLAVLEVVRMRPPRFVGEEHSAGDDHVWVMLDAPSRQIQVPRLADARPWLVAAASIPLHEPQALRQAEAVRDRVRKAGFPDVELLDSRQATRLFCCHLLVVAARTATRSEADALVHRAKKAGLVTYPVQGW